MDSDLVNIKTSEQIHNLIYIIRGKQVMLDRDLATLYQVETKVLNQAVKRNLKRFPQDFRFQLNDNETNELVTNCDQLQMLKHSSSNPYAFTEQGIAMLSSVLRSDVAIEISIKIMNTFVEMRKFLTNNQNLFSRLKKVELQQLEYQKSTNKNFEKIFNHIATKTEAIQKIFFNGQIYDAFSLLIDIVKKAETKIILIDNYVDTDTLNILCKRKDNVQIKIYTSNKSFLSKQDIKKFNSQYKNLTIKYLNNFHDRFLILDDKLCYHIGASLKDAGKKSFAISKIVDEKLINEILNRLT